MSITKNSCNKHLRSPLPEVHIGNGRCGGEPGAGLPRIWLTDVKQQPLHVTGVKGPLQMLCDVFEVSM
jgi:hypothetical protein